MHEMHVRCTRFMYSACVPFTQNEERIQNVFS